MKTKNKQIFLWSLYDFANQPFSTLIVTFIFATFFTATFAKSDDGVLWGYAITISSILIAITSPFIGALADYSGRRKKYFSFFTISSIFFIGLLFFCIPGRISPFVPLLIFVLANVSFEIAFSLYNSYLPNISNEKNVGRISGNAWAFGFVGGLLALVISLYIIIPGLSKDEINREQIDISTFQSLYSNVDSTVSAVYKPYFKNKNLLGYEIFSTTISGRKLYTDFSPLIQVDSLFYHPIMISYSDLEQHLQINNSTILKSNLFTKNHPPINIDLLDIKKNIDKQVLTPIFRVDSFWYFFNDPDRIKSGMDTMYYHFTNTAIDKNNDIIHEFIKNNNGSSLIYDQFINIRMTCLFVAFWFLCFSLPTLFFLNHRESDLKNNRYMDIISQSIKNLNNTFHEIKKNYLTIAKFLLARLFYNDGLITIFAFGGIYAQEAFGFTFTEVMYFGIFLSITAALGAFLFGYIVDIIGGVATIQISNIGMIVATIFAVMLPNDIIFENTNITGKKLFWLAGFFIGLFSGPIQSASRSVMARLTPIDKQSEFFGFYALSGKATAFVGPFLLATLNSFFHSPRPGVLIVSVLILIGTILLARISADELKV